MGATHSKKRAKEGRAVGDTNPGEADDTARVSHSTSNPNSHSVPSGGTSTSNTYSSSILPDGPGCATDNTQDAPQANCFFLESAGIKDKDIIQLVRTLAKEKGPQRDGYSTVICGITVRWQKLEALGGDPPRKRSETPLEKVANPQGNNAPVRALYPQLPPPGEPRA